MTRLAVAALLVAGVGLGQDFVLWQGSGFPQSRVRAVQTEEIYPDGPPTDGLSLPLTLVVFDKTNWTEARAIRHIRKTADIFAPCGIRLSGVQLARVQAPGGRRDLRMGEVIEGSEIPKDVYELSRLAPADAVRPVVYFAGRFDGSTALARSYPRGDVNPSETATYPYLDSAWIAYRTHWIERAEDGYSSLAHELAHLLCECGHRESDRRHLLHPYRNFLGREILPEDCEKMRSSPLLGGSPKQ